MRVPLGESVLERVAAPDGGAWVGINHQLDSKPPLVGRASPRRVAWALPRVTR